MGCDIHAYLELKDDKGNWFCANPTYVDHTHAKTRIKQPELDLGRDYDIFAQLADVRNEHDLPFIDQPRGLPDDASIRVKDASQAWEPDGHSHSYVTLAEINDFYQKHRDITISGYISAKQKILYDKYHVNPTSYCSMTSNKSYVEHTWQRPNPLSNLRFDLDSIIIMGYGYRKDMTTARLVFWFDN